MSTSLEEKMSRRSFLIGAVSLLALTSAGCATTIKHQRNGNFKETEMPQKKFPSVADEKKNQTPEDIKDWENPEHPQNGIRAVV